MAPCSAQRFLSHAIYSLAERMIDADKFALEWDEAVREWRRNIELTLTAHTYICDCGETVMQMCPKCWTTGPVELRDEYVICVECSVAIGDCYCEVGE